MGTAPISEARTTLAAFSIHRSGLCCAQETIFSLGTQGFEAAFARVRGPLSQAGFRRGSSRPYATKEVVARALLPGANLEHNLPEQRGLEAQAPILPDGTRDAVAQSQPWRQRHSWRCSRIWRPSSRLPSILS